MLFLSVAFLCSGDLTLNMGFSHTLLLELLEFGSSVNLFKIVFFQAFEWKNDGLIGCDCQIQAGAFDLSLSPANPVCSYSVVTAERTFASYIGSYIASTRKHALNCRRFLWEKLIQHD